MSLSYNIDKLLSADDNSSNTDDKLIEDVSDTSVSDNEDQNDLDQSEFTPYIRKFNRRNKSNAPDDIRLRVNSRERQRMHDLNSAMDSLRQVMPYSQGPSVKKISKMATLMLARNYIVMLNKSLDEMRRMVNELSHQQSSPAQQRAPSAAVSGIDKLHHSVSGHIPLQPTVLTPPTHFVYSADYFHTQVPVSPHMSNFYTPLKLAGVQKTEAEGVHTQSMPCPCQFCQTSLTSLPKPKWKQTC